MSDIVLATVNARYSHSAIGLRCLKANLEEFSEQTTISEFILSDKVDQIVERILSFNPKIVGLSAYIWNVNIIGEIIDFLKAVRPDLTVILGGPEVVCPEDLPAFAVKADYIVSGEGEVAFCKLCRDLLSGRQPAERMICLLPDLEKVRLPYELYSDEDIANRIIYLEASRGCPFGCEFCLSALDSRVRKFEGDKILAAIERLWQRGARRFKFIDRTLQLAITPKLLGFFLDRLVPELFVHFELVPGQLSPELFELIAAFPQGTLQLEVGVQSFDQDVCSRITRRHDLVQVEKNLVRLLSKTKAHLHTDLVVGLPGETLESLEAGFNRLLAIKPHEVQVGILKRLRGAPIERHSGEWQMVYRASPPYDILQNKTITFSDMQRLKRFARYFDLVYNSGNFKSTADLLVQGESAFAAFMRFSNWLHAKSEQTAAISLTRLAGYLFEYLTRELSLADEQVANQIQADFDRAGRTKGMPEFVRRKVSIESRPGCQDKVGNRQERHQ
jgi:radical SAM superfamily enzyme YgiQ (UPF0313 family)